MCLPDIYFDGNRGLLNSPFLRDVLLYVNEQEPSGAAVPGILYSVSNVYFACKKKHQTRIQCKLLFAHDFVFISKCLL